VLSKPGGATQILNNSGGQILALPAHGALPGSTRTMMIGDKNIVVKLRQVGE